MHNINKTKREDEEVEEKAYTKQKLIEIPKPTIRSTKLINFLCEFAKINKQIRGRIYLQTKNIPRWVVSSAVFNAIKFTFKGPSFPFNFIHFHSIPLDFYSISIQFIQN